MECATYGHVHLRYGIVPEVLIINFVRNILIGEGARARSKHVYHIYRREIERQWSELIYDVPDKNDSSYFPSA